MSWTEIKHALNKSLGTSNFKSLDTYIREKTILGDEDYTTYYLYTASGVNGTVIDVTGEGYFSGFCLYIPSGKNGTVKITIDDKVYNSSHNGTGTGMAGLFNKNNVFPGKRGNYGSFIRMRIDATPTPYTELSSTSGPLFSTKEIHFKNKLKIETTSNNTSNEIEYMYHIKNN